MRTPNAQEDGCVTAQSDDDEFMALPHVLLDLPKGHPTSIEDLCRTSDGFRDACEDYCHFRIILNLLEAKGPDMLPRDFERYRSFVDNAKSHILSAISAPSEAKQDFD